MRSAYLRLAEEVLRRNPGRPMTAAEIWDYGTLHGLAPDAKGETPWQTVKSKITVDIRRYAKESIFARAAPGRFVLRRTLNSSEYPARRWAPPAVREEVAVFRSSHLDSLGRFQGVSKSTRKLYDGVLRSSIVSTLDRPTAEGTEKFKQLLTYIMVVRGAEVLSFVRGTSVSSERSLRGLACLGFGGHVNSQDFDLWATDDVGLFSSAARELREELDLPQADLQRLERGEGLELVGFLNDDSSPVGRRHFAAVLRYEVSSDTRWDDPQKGEKSIRMVRWVDPLDPAFDLTSYEYWSQLLVREYFPGARASKPSFRLRRAGTLRNASILCVVGQMGSGKTEACRVLESDFGFKTVRSGHVMAELLGVPPIPITPRADMQELAQAFISSQHGPRLLAERLMAACEDEASAYLVDGIRQLRTLEALRGLAGSRGTGVLYVHAPPDVAYRFYRRREDHDANYLDFFRMRDSAVESEVPEMLDVADAVLYNWFGTARYRAAVHDLFRTTNWGR